MSVISDRLSLIDTVKLEVGSHASFDDGVCVMEAVAYVAGEPFTDHPQCASPVLSSFLRSWNDSLDDYDRQMLKPFIPRLVGTNTGTADEEIRAWMLTDWLAREVARGFLRLAGLTEQATVLEQLAALTDSESARAAQPTLDAARTDAAAARDAAWAAAWAAGDDYDARYQGALKAATPLINERFGATTKALQKSALLLLDRMIDVSKAAA